MGAPPHFSRWLVCVRRKELERSTKKVSGIYQKKKQNLHTMTINFLKYTITIYPLRNDSLVKKKMKEKKLSGNQKLKKRKKYSHTFRHHKQSARLGCTAPIITQLKWHNFIDSVEAPIGEKTDRIKVIRPNLSTANHKDKGRRQ